MTKRFLLFLVIAGILLAGCPTETEIEYRDKIVDPSDWLGTAPGITADMCSGAEITADVVVIGAGVSGLSAARAAAEELKGTGKVVIIEKSTDIFARGLCFGALNSSYQKSIGQVLNAQEQMDVALTMHKMSGNRSNLALWKKWAFESGAAFDWFVEAFALEGSGWNPATDFPLLGTQKGKTAAVAGTPFDTTGTNDKGYYLQYFPQVGTNELWTHHATSHNFQTATGMAGNWPMALGAQKNAIIKAGGEFVFDTEAKELIVDENGNVVGVYVQNVTDQKYAKVNATRGVILATGDYGANETMVKYLCPEFATAIGQPKAGSGTGDGHKMAIWAGGMMEPAPHAHMSHSMMFGSMVGVLSTLQLNENGKRFMNEDVSGQLITNAVARQPMRKMIQIYDSDVMARLDNVMNDSHGAQDFSNLTTKEHVQAIIDEAEGGADTLEALAKAIFPEDPVAEASALAAMNRYNELYAAGFDADFGVNKDKMWPLLKPPFFFTRSMVAAGVITAGVMVDEELRVLKETNYRPIPGLWAVGNTAGGRYAGDYPVNAAATSHGTAVTFGKSAGIAAANYTP